MPLTAVKIGEERKIKKINGKDEAKKFLNNLGFNEGEVVKIISEIAGNVVVLIKNTRIALDRSMTNRIIVE